MQRSREKGNDHQFVKLVIVNQMLFISTIGNANRVKNMNTKLGCNGLSARKKKTKNQSKNKKNDHESKAEITVREGF